MGKLNIDWKRVGNTIKNGGGLLIGVAICTLPYLDSVKRVVESVRYYCGDVKYSDAVSEILNSDMYSSAKEESIKLLPKDGTSELYRSVIQVVNSDTYSSNRVNIIKDICCEREEA